MVVFGPGRWHSDGMSESAPRLDKWLWAVRAFKTRSHAAEACRLGRVIIAAQTAKPARAVKVGDIIFVKQSDMTRSFKVLQPLDRRVGAALVKNYAEDLTPPSEYEKHRPPDFRPFAFRPKGAGRPTKKERRALVLPKD
jgi:ribosome-associated heat shock protein Hsp15